MIQGELFDQEDKKWCYKCDRYLDPDQFYSDSTKKDHKDNKCKECTYARENSVKFKFRRIKQGADKRGYDFTLELQDTSGMLLDSCYYCGKEAQGEKVKLHGLDRVENDRGYHQDNVVTCCIECNRAKHKQTQEEFIKQAHRIANRHPIHNKKSNVECRKVYLENMQVGEIFQENFDYPVW